MLSNCEIFLFGSLIATCKFRTWVRLRKDTIPMKIRIFRKLFSDEGVEPSPAEDGKWRGCAGNRAADAHCRERLSDSFCHVRTSVLGFLLGLVQFFCLSSTRHCSAVSAFDRLVAGMPAGAPWSLFSCVDLSGAL